MRVSFIDRGGLWVVVQFALLLLVVGLGLACPSASKHLILFVAGLSLLIISAMCGIAGVVALGRNLTPFPRPLTQSRFVGHGIYSRIRHPLYTSVLCGAVGWSLFRGSWSALVVSLVLAVFFDAKARREEQWLRERFAEYADYSRRVQRFIPWIY